jgi:hypothetical protein
MNHYCIINLDEDYCTGKPLRPPIKTPQQTRQRNSARETALALFTTSLVFLTGVLSGYWIQFLI